MHPIASRRRIASVCSVVAAWALALTTAGGAHAAPAPRFSLGDTDCGVAEYSGLGGVGLATSFPDVRAVDATYARDMQWVTVRNDLYQWVGNQWQLIVRDDTYQGWAADNNYVVSFQNQRTGQRSLVSDRNQFILRTSGGYRVAQAITWHRNGAVPGYSVYSWLKHYPGALNNSFCVVA